MRNRIKSAPVETGGPTIVAPPVAIAGGWAARAVVLAGLVVLAQLCLGHWDSGAFAAEGCSANTASVRASEPFAEALPDCRAYEQVSPVAKNGADALDQAQDVQAAVAGGAVSYFSLQPFRGSAGAKNGTSEQLSFRSTSPEWLTESPLPVADVGPSKERVVGESKDLSRTVIITGEPALAEGAALGPNARNAYVRNNATGQYSLLAANVGVLTFVDAAMGGRRILVESTTPLSVTNGTPVPGFPNLYEWNEDQPPGERLSLAGVLPDGEAPSEGSVAGPGGPAAPGYGASTPGGALDQFYTEHSIAESGKQIDFTAAETGVIYLREPEAGVTEQVSGGSRPAHWRAATPDGTYVFYSEGGAGEEELYRYSRAKNNSENLTTGAEGLRGTLGVSSDGSYAYFVATGKLAGNVRVSPAGTEEAVEGADNLYEWHEGTLIFVARLHNEQGQGDEMDWFDRFESVTHAGAGSGIHSSRVSPDGQEVLFSSVNELTNYPNDQHYELYLYNATEPPSAENPVCVSCNPSGAPATASVFLSPNITFRAVAPAGANLFLPHNLSEDGGRVFFETSEALVAAASNGQNNVYEWERVGDGSCRSGGSGFVTSSGGCLYLISTGHSANGSYIGDASANGDDVYFFTRQSLVGQDQDQNEDVYDARVEGGIAAQNPVPSTPCAGEGACREAVGPSPEFEVASSSLLTGMGNLPSAPVVSSAVVTKKAKAKLARCSKRRRSSHGKCVRRRAKRGGHVSRASGVAKDATGREVGR